MLISAYNLMQRVSIGLELVYKSLEMSDSAYVNNNGNFWKLTCEQSLRVIESIFLNLKIVDFPAENLPILKREITPQNAVCINSESTRNLRDFVIMQDSLKIVEFYLNMAKIEQQFQQRQLVQRAAFNPLTGKTTFSITY